jgi:hypothetical protein
MEFQKIQVTKKNTLNMVFKNENGDIVSVAGANIVHKDLKAAVNNLIPHIALMTEQRETFNKTLKEVEACRIQDNDNNSVYKWMTVDTITIGDDGSTYALSGNRILQTGDVIKVESPNVMVANHDKYAYLDELALAVDAVIYEAEAYYKEQKWGIKEGSLDFADDDPFNAENLTADQVPETEVKEMKTKKTKKSKSA